MQRSERDFYDSVLFGALKDRMLQLAQKPTEQFRPYTHHLSIMGINLYSYLTPGPITMFTQQIKGEDISKRPTDKALDKMILGLVDAQDRAWNKNSSNDTMSTLNKVYNAKWNFSNLQGDAWLMCSNKETTQEIIQKLAKHNITATLKRHTTEETSAVYIETAYGQIQHNYTENPTNVQNRATEAATHNETNEADNNLTHGPAIIFKH
jgi:hypothetical protein